jgi:hypothetical protein
MSTAQRPRTSEGGSNNAQGRAREALPPSTNTPETAPRPKTGEGGSARQGGSAARQLLSPPPSRCYLQMM